MPEDEQNILRFEIDGTWTVDDFIQFLSSITYVYELGYNLGKGMEIAVFDRKALQLRSGKSYKAWLKVQSFLEGSSGLKPLREERLYVNQIRFGSAGLTDL